jgi:cytosine/adenosine deaminase-related metal-dependent hydrolase
VIIRNAAVLDFQNLSQRSRVDLRIADGRIAEIGQGSTVEGPGRGISPSAAPGEDVNEQRWFNDYVWMYERNLTPGDVYVGTPLGVAGMRAGTILAHAYYSKDSDLELIRDSGAGVARCAKTYLKFGDAQDFLLRALADLVLIDPAAANMVPEHNVFANLLYALSERNIHTVIVGGRVVVRGGTLETIDLKELIAETVDIVSRITNRDYSGPLQRY